MSGWSQQGFTHTPQCDAATGTRITRAGYGNNITLCAGMTWYRSLRKIWVYHGVVDRNVDKMIFIHLIRQLC